MQSLQLSMRAGQVAVSPVAGAASDRYGNRPVLELSQVLVSVALLFFAIATPHARWWIVGAYVLWSAYAGINICLTNIMLKLAPPRDNAGHIAVFEALGGLSFGLSTIAGGVLFDQLSAVEFALSIGPIELDYFALLFLGGAIARLLGVVWLARIDEPSARTWREILTCQR